MKQRLTTIAVTLLVLLASAATTPAADILRTHSKGTVSGTITAMSPEQIEVTVKGLKTRMSVGDVISIRYDEEPEDLSTARTRIASGQLQEAIELLRGIDQDGIDSSVIKQDIMYFEAYAASQLALGGAASLREAGTLLNKFVKENPGSYHFFEANELLGDLLVAGGRADGAMAYYDKAAQAPWPSAKVRIALAQARALQAQDKHSEAIVEFEKVLGSNIGGELGERFRLAATLGKAGSLARIKQGEAGLKLVHGVIKSAVKGDTEIHARGYLAMGDCYMAMGNPKAAVMAYLHVDALYYQHPALHAEALARIANLWEQMDKPERSAAARKTLMSSYPSSKWAKS